MELGSDFQTFSEKILSILIQNDALLHSQIKEIADKNPKMHRSSSRTFYKAYNYLISKDFVRKVLIDRDVLNQQTQQKQTRSYWGYQITLKGKEYLELMQKNVGFTLKQTEITKLNRESQINDQFVKIADMLITAIKTQIQSPLLISIPQTQVYEQNSEISTFPEPIENMVSPQETPINDNIEIADFHSINSEEANVEDFTTIEKDIASFSNEDLLNALGTPEIPFDESFQHIILRQNLRSDDKKRIFQACLDSISSKNLFGYVKQIPFTAKELQILFEDYSHRNNKKSMKIIFDLLLNQSISKEDLIDLFDFCISLPNQKSIEPYLNQLPLSNEDLLNYAQQHINDKINKIPNQIIELLLKKNLDIEQKVSLLEYIYLLDKKSEYINKIDLPLAILLQVAYVTPQPQLKLFFLGLSVKKLLSETRYDWNDIIPDFQINNHYITKNEIVHAYLDICYEINEIDKAYNLLVFLMKNYQINYVDYLKLLRICLNLQMIDRLYSFIDEYGKNFLNSSNITFSIPPETKFHEIMIYLELPLEFDSIKLILMEALIEQHSIDEIRGMKLPTKWAIATTIEDAYNTNHLQGFPISPYLEYLSSKLKQLKQEQTSIDEFQFFLQNLFEEETLLIFTPYFAKWLFENEGLQKTIQILEKWVSNEKIRQIYSLTYEKILKLLVQWEPLNKNQYQLKLDQLEIQNENLKKIIT